MCQHEVSQWSGYAGKPKTSSSCDQRLGAANGYLIVTLAVKLQSNQCFHRIGHPYNGLNSASSSRTRLPRQLATGRSLMRQISIAMAVLLGMPALTPAWVNAQVHRCIEKDGTLVYSDKPCLNESSRASTSQARTAPASKAKTGTVAYSQDVRVFKELQGTWSVASAKRNGTSHVDQKWIGSEWIFRADTLYLTVERPSREMREYTVAVDAGAEPKVLHLAAESAGEKSGWMLFSRVGGALRIAFYDNLERRPKSFDVDRRTVDPPAHPAVSALPPVAADDGCGSCARPALTICSATATAARGARSIPTADSNAGRGDKTQFI